MKIIGLSGKKQSGKDTVAQFIKEYLFETRSGLVYQKIGFADALYREVAIGLTYKPPYTPGQLTEEYIQAQIEYIKEHKDNFRLILQGWGTDYRRELCDSDYWVNKVKSKIALLANNSCVVVPDVRFVNEMKSLGSAALIIRVNRVKDGVQDNHPSEQYLGWFNDRYDHVIDNCSTLKDLKDQVYTIMKQTFTLYE